jgi:hypothetical protein
MEHSSTADLRIFSEENMRTQAESAPLRLGYKELEFYVDDQAQPAKAVTEKYARFYLSPSGGTLRDEHMNIVTYSARWDMYKGYGKA